MKGPDEVLFDILYITYNNHFIYLRMSMDKENNRENNSGADKPGATSYVLTFFIEFITCILLFSSIQSLGYNRGIDLLYSMLGYYGLRFSLTTFYRAYLNSNAYKTNDMLKPFLFFIPSLIMILCYFLTLIFFFPAKNQEINKAQETPTVLASTTKDENTTTNSFDVIPEIELTPNEISSNFTNDIHYSFQEDNSFTKRVSKDIMNKNLSNVDKLFLEKEANTIDKKYENLLLNYNLLVLEEKLFIKKLSQIKNIDKTM